MSPDEIEKFIDADIEHRRLDELKDIKLKNFSRLCYSLFNSDDGKEFLEYLETILMSPVADPSKDSRYAYFREGENNLIRRIKAGISMFINLNLQD